MKKIYIMENLGCANCASKIEQRVAALPGVNEAVITFATKQLRLDAENPSALLPKIQKIANSLEPDILITERTRSQKKSTEAISVPFPTDSPREEGHSHAHEEKEHHQHENSCSCDEHHVHEEDGHHLHEDSCSCGGHHSHEEPTQHHASASLPPNPAAEYQKTNSALNSTKKIYILENLGCANCTSKIESRINELPQVNNAVITFATKQLRLDAENPDALLPEIQKIANSLEPDIMIVERSRGRRNTGRDAAAHLHDKNADHEHMQNESVHHHEEAYSCGHSHAHKELVNNDEACRCGEEPMDNTTNDYSSTIHAESPSVNTPAKPKGFLAVYGKELLPILAGAVLFIAGEILEHMNQPTAAFILALAAYVLLGGRIIITAIKNLFHGQLFDENFLMSVATIGAFCIQEYLEAVGVMLFYRVGEFFEHVAVERSRNQIMDAVDLRPEVVNLVQDGQVKVIDAEDAQVGDILLVRPGDRIPLDGVVVEGESRIDTSPVTGEPVPVRAVSGDAVTSGCVNTTGQLKIRAEKILEESMVTRILDSVENAAASKPRIDRFITRFARIYTPIVIFLALGTAILPSLVSGNWNYWVYTALTFLVMSCPCALVLSVPLAFFSGIGAGSKKGILFKGGISLEAIRNIKTVIMDKTGTITQGNFEVQKVIPRQGEADRQVLSLCASCEISSTHPIAVSIVTAAREQGLNIERPAEVEEIAGHGIRAIVGDEEILCGSQKLLERYHINLQDYIPTTFGTEVLAAKNGVYMGYLVISDTIKADAKTAVSALKNQGITPVMLTGDAKESAQAVAQETGITEVHARLLPQDKVAELSKIRSTHGAVMFVGDGINDAPVLAGADVGAAMGSGADAAIEAADVVFMTSSMEAIPQAISIARRTNTIAVQNVVFALMIKVAVMILGLCGFASMWMAVFADSGVAMLCVLNSIRVLYSKKF